MRFSTIRTAARVTGRARRAVRVVTDAVRSVVAPAALVRQAAAPVDVVDDPDDLFTPDEMPALEEIATAAALHTAAADQARAADRGKRKARKTLDRLPSGLYGRWLVERVASTRETPDLVAIRATYKQLGLGDVPMRPCAPSLRLVEIADAAVPAIEEQHHGAVLVAA